MPEDDRGEWAPHAIVIFNYENGLRNPHDCDDCRCIDKYDKVQDKIRDSLNENVYMEDINWAVGAIYVI